MPLLLLTGFLVLCLLVQAAGSRVLALDKPTGENSTIYNPMLPGFHPDPSCIFVREWNSTFFCASSTFNAFPGIPIHASKDLQNWKLIGI
jgi:beta-xylosidase